MQFSAETPDTLVHCQHFTLEPHREYLFRAQVRGNDRAWIAVGERRLGYQNTGEWQTLTDVVRTPADGTLSVRVFLGGLNPAGGQGGASVTLPEDDVTVVPPKQGRNGKLEVSDLSLEPVSIPALPARTPFNGTPVTRGNQPLAVIVCPSGRPALKRLAQSVSATICERTGATLRVLEDTAVTEAHAPVLLPQFRTRPLILIGRLGINRAFWTAYGRFLCATDGHYPGGDGFEIRTAANVLPGKTDHIILGGSSDKGIARAVENFLQILTGTPLTADGSLSLPWLLQVELGGRCRELFQSDDELWQAEPLHPTLPPLEPGYGTIVRWYVNAMGYYWSGYESYRQRAAQLLDRIVAEQAYTHHYVSEWLVRVHDMLDDSPAFSREQVAAMDNLIHKTFWEHLTGSDLCRMEIFAPPYEAIPLDNRHNIAPWMADLSMAEFLQKNFTMPAWQSDMLEYRRREKEAILEDCLATRWDGSLPSLSGCDNEEEIIASLYRYALEHDRYGFFSSGNAARALLLERINHRFGRLTRPAGPYDFKPLLAVLAHLSGDGRYVTLWRDLPDCVPEERIFQRRYIMGVGRYTPCGAIPAQSADNLAGVTAAPLQPHNLARLRNGAIPDSIMPDCSPERIPDMVLLRSGFGSADDYVAVSGTGGHCPPGAFIDFTAAGEYWFGSGISAIRFPPPKRYFDHNALHLLCRTEDRLPALSPYPAAAELDWLADFGDSGGLALLMSPYGPALWRRTVIRVRRGLYLVADSIHAAESGLCDISINWLPEGKCERRGNSLVSRQGDAALCLTPLADSFDIFSRNAATGTTAKNELRLLTTRHLQPQTVVTAATVLETIPAQDKFSDVEQIAESAVMLQDSPTAGKLLVLFGSLELPDFVFKGAAAIFSSGQVQVMHAHRLDIHGTTYLHEAGAVSVSLKLPGLEPPALASLILSAKGGAPESDARADLSATRSEENAVTETWRYDGLLLPAILRDTSPIDDRILDLGREAHIAEIRGYVSAGPWAPSPIPDDLLGAAQTEDGQPPPPDSPLWQSLTDDAAAAWIPGLATGNYGRADHVAEARQVLKLNGKPMRYLQGRRLTSLCCYNESFQEARTPFKLVAADLNGDGRPQILLLPDPWPAFLRRRELENSLIAALSPQGTELFRLQISNGIQSARVLHLDNSPRLVILTDDAIIRILEPDGRVQSLFSLYDMHRKFNLEHGRPETRHPAGGLTMPYDIGAWRPDRDGRRKLLISRYCAFSFLDQEGNFEGVLHNRGTVNVGYVICRLLGQGVDFNGDGVEEQLALGLEALHHIDGEATAVIPDPEGTYFYPQVYREETLRLPATGGTVDGTRPLCFETVALAAESDTPRYVLVARTSFLALYDGAQRCWAFQWKPAVDLTAVAIAEDTFARLQITLACLDGRLWSFDLCDTGQIEARSVKSMRLPGRVRRLRRLPGGNMLACTDSGLYLVTSDLLASRLAGGDWQDAIGLPENPGTVIAVTQRGEVMRLDSDPE